MAGKRKKPTFITHGKGADGLRRRSRSPPAVKRKHLNFSYKNAGNVSISESSSIVVNENVTHSTENASHGNSELLNQSETDPVYQEFLAEVMLDEPSGTATKEREVEVGSYLMMLGGLAG